MADAAQEPAHNGKIDVKGQNVNNIQADTVTIQYSQAGDIKANTVTVSQAGAGNIEADTVELRQAGAQVVHGQNITVRQGGVLQAKAGSLILTHSLDGTVPGLKDWPPQDRPHVATVFWSFRVMVGCGVLMLGIVLWSVLLRTRKRLFDNPLFLKTCVLAGPIGFIAVVAGWFTTETGRQPWLIFNVMRTFDGASPGVPAGSVLLSLALYAATYAIIFGAGVFFILQTVRQGPR